MVKESKFYDLLDVSTDSSDADLKEAYQAKALCLHPDNGGDPDVFKEVTRAYQVLSDPEKRSIYDARGETGLSEQSDMGGMDPQDSFSQLLSGGDGPGGRQQGPKKTEDLVHRVSVSLEDLYKGKTTKVSLTRNVICKTCSGKGTAFLVRTCTSCNGKGYKVHMRQIGPNIHQIRSVCDECKGTGEIFDSKSRCPACKCKKVVPEKKLLEVHIDKGMKGGEAINFRGESDQSPTAEPGDVIIVIEEKPHERFTRKDNDLIIDTEVDLTSLGGGQVVIKHLDDRALIVKIQPGEVIKHGDVKVIYGQGMPSRQHHEPGDMYVKFNIKSPEDIDPSVIHHLEAALPPRQPLDKFPKNYVVEEVNLSEIGHHTRHNEDDDEVQRANQ